MQARRERGYGNKLSRVPRRLGGASSLKNIKYTRMRQIKKQNSKTFSPDGLHDMLAPGPPRRVSEVAVVMAWVHFNFFVKVW